MVKLDVPHLRAAVGLLKAWDARRVDNYDIFGEGVLQWFRAVGRKGAPLGGGDEVKTPCGWGWG